MEFNLPEMSQLWQETLGWQPDVSQQKQFQQLYQLILQGNQQLNLTRITAPEEFWEKHLWDSLRGIKPWLEAPNLPTFPLPSPPVSVSPCLPIPPSFRVIDIGTGAGLPGIPVAIARPDWTVTLLDSVRKKVAFLETLLTALEIEGEAIADRVEQMGQHSQYREAYDLALVRAVATASVCAEYALPLLKVGGMAVLYRGQWTTEEAIALSQAAEMLGGILEATESFTTPLSHGVRHCLYLKKTRSTPEKYPRPVGVPAQKPL